MNGIPDEFSLEQNYPNPFNPITRIDFSILEAEMVSLKIFDIFGRSISKKPSLKAKGVYVVKTGNKIFRHCLLKEF